MNKGIAIAGNLVVDEIKWIEHYPNQHALAGISDVTRSMGGLLCNCIVDLAKLDPNLPLTAIGYVGEDERGDYILQELKSYPSIDLTSVRRRGKTAFTDVMTTPDGGRTFFHHQGASPYLTPESFDFTKIHADILHAGYILLMDGLDAPDDEYKTKMTRVLAEARRHGLKTSIDVVSREDGRFRSLVIPALAYTDYCIINEIEASGVTGIALRNADGAIIKDAMRPALTALLEAGVGEWAIVHAPELSCGLSKDGEFVMRQSLRLPPGYIVSSVGAGDAFAAGILYGAYKGWNLEKSISTAAAVAAKSLSGVGASDALRPLDEVLEEMGRYGGGGGGR